MENKLIDMHIHTKSSYDAVNSIEDILTIAEKNNCSYIAITDHNSLNEINEFYNKNKIKKYNVYANVKNIKLVSGVEVTSKLKINGKNNTVHLLVYGPRNLKSSPIGRLVDIKNKHDNVINYGIIDYLKKHNINITEEQLNNYITLKLKSGNNFPRIEKSDIIKINKMYNIVSSAFELENVLNSFNRNHYLNLSAKDVINLAHKSDAFCLIAHPSINLRDERLQSLGAKLLAKYNLDGFEKDYNKKNRRSLNVFENKLTNYSNKKLVSTAGSDNHNINRNNNIGSTYYKKLYETDYNLPQYIEKLQTRRLSRVKALGEKYNSLAPIVKISNNNLTSGDTKKYESTLYFPTITPELETLRYYKNLSNNILNSNNTKTMVS